MIPRRNAHVTGACTNVYTLFMSLSLFHPIVAGWFANRFNEPTDAQLQGWPRIVAGEHTLVAAPTGSGKTLAAFLASIDNLLRQSIDGKLPDETQVVYV